MSDQADLQTSYTRFERLGEGVKDYYGPIHSRYFAANLTIVYPHNTTSAQNLTLVVETSSFPHGGGSAADRDNGPGKELVMHLHRLLSQDRAVQQAEILDVLNRQLTRMRASDDFMPKFESVMAANKRVQSVNKSALRVHPLTIAAVASSLAERPHRQDHVDIEFVLEAAGPEERARLEQTLHILDQPNDEIKIVVDHARRRAYISGIRLPLALQKLHAAQVVVLDSDIGYLAGDLKRLVEKYPNLHEFNESEVTPVAEALKMLRDKKYANSKRPAPGRTTGSPVPHSQLN